MSEVGRSSRPLPNPLKSDRWAALTYILSHPRTSIQRTLTKRSCTSTAVAFVFTRLKARTPNVHLLPTSRA